MIVRAGHPTSVLVQFTTGHPDGVVSWTLLGDDGASLATGTVTVPIDAVSVNIPVSAPNNTLPSGALFSFRDLEWSYAVGGAVIADSLRYSIEAIIPLGVSPDGVRNKLGVSRADLPDDEIPLVKSYLSFQNSVGEAEMAAAVDGGLNDLILRDAIEATAALSLVPTMIVRVAVSEDSGTNKFKRDAVDWTAIGASLDGYISAGTQLIIPGVDFTLGFGSLLVLATPSTDPITGSAPA